MLKKSRKLLVAMLAVCMVLSCVPLAPYAETQTEGTEAVNTQAVADDTANNEDLNIDSENDAATEDAAEAEGSSTETEGERAQASEEAQESETATEETEQVSEPEETADSNVSAQTKRNTKSLNAANKGIKQKTAVSTASDDDAIVCKIGSKGFPSINDAVAYATAGEETTIVMVADVTQEETVVIPADKNIVLKDDGTTRTVTASDKSLFNVSGTLTIDATENSKLVLDGGNSNVKNIGHVEGTMNLKSGTINGRHVTAVTGALYVEHGTFNMSGGIFQNTECTYSGFDGPIKISDGGTMNMTGGEIKENHCLSGAGIVAVSMDMTQTPTVNISGGRIHHNSGLLGVALMAPYNANVTISGGEFSDNVDRALGETSYSQSGTIYISRAKLTMTGGVIKDNQMRRGGGIYISRESEVNITGGSITNNSAEEYGGAIFMDDSKPNTYLKNALITDNTANKTGGGIWCCPTGSAKISATEGVAVFDNKAKEAGDDLTNLCTDRQSFPVALSDHMLGAGKVGYYKDGAIQTLEKGDKEYWHGAVDPSAPRYNSNSEKIDPSAIGTECLALKSIASEGAKASARKHATTVITGNSATYGGAIACNASLFGSSSEINDEWSLKVQKKWSDVAEDEQVPVTIALVVDGEEVDTVELSSENNWEATFTNLPDPITLKSGYSVVEKTEGFKVEYSEITESLENPNTLETTVTNSKETPPEDEYLNPPDDDTPDEEEVTTTEETTKPEKETADKPAKPENKNNGNSPRTGDDSNMTLTIIEIVLAAGAAIYLLKRRIRN